MTFWGNLSFEELAWLIANIIGMILATAATFEAQMDAESVKILGERGLIAGADVEARILKATGGRRDEGIKAGVHAVLLVIGIIVAASPAPRQEYEGFTATWAAIGIVIIAVALSVGSVYTLIDRRRLWKMFKTYVSPPTMTDEEHTL